MALISEFERVEILMPKRHGQVDCTYTVFSVAGGKKYIQLNTFGSRKRDNPGKQSQTI